MADLSRQILDLLRENGRLSDQDIALQLQVTDKKVATCREALEKSGRIVGYAAIVDEDGCVDSSYAIRAYVELSVRPEKKTGYDAIAKRIYKYPNVCGQYLLSGQYDFLVVVEGRSHQEIASFVFDKLATLDSVVTTNTHFVFKKYKEHGVLLEQEKAPPRMPVVA
ncbi:AsnC family transcriptional regulator [Candidatus Marinamargulisbacteria bacterium SCGC AG-439-L15]|nr:AsnC family transcriptional regulator [Candidatus Marinamargulisbacteria bacterium SCGC AG-439-L15]